MAITDKAKQAIAKVNVRPMSTQVAEVRTNINLLQEAMAATMKRDVHYGVIAGTQKPTLYKAGAEVIMALFKLSVDPEVNDLSKGEEIRYQVKVRVMARDGSFVGSGIGECSSREEKYMWRAAVCEEEFDVTPETHRRIKFKKNRYNGSVEKIQQVRVEPSDMANTILKMAKKRALIDAVLTATGASDIFHQDLEDLPDGFVAPEAEVEVDLPPVADEPENIPVAEIQKAKERAEMAQAVPEVDPSLLISEKQRKRLYAIAMSAGMDRETFKEWLLFTFNLESSKDILKSDYEQICAEAQAYKGGE